MRAMEPSEANFVELVRCNPTVAEVLHRAESLDLPNWYLTAGCLFQTVWNVLDGHDPERGIKDYDLFYFDEGDRSWDAEDEVKAQHRSVRRVRRRGRGPKRSPRPHVVRGEVRCAVRAIPEH